MSRRVRLVSIRLCNKPFVCFHRCTCMRSAHGKTVAIGGLLGFGMKNWPMSAMLVPFCLHLAGERPNRHSLLLEIHGLRLKGAGESQRCHGTLVTQHTQHKATFLPYSSRNNMCLGLHMLAMNGYAVSMHVHHITHSCIPSPSPSL